jgi:hypothetical protein
MRMKDMPKLEKLLDTAGVTRKRVTLSDTNAAIAYVRSVGGKVITRH